MQYYFISLNMGDHEQYTDNIYRFSNEREEIGTSEKSGFYLIIFLFFGLAVNLSSFLIAFGGSLIIAREIWVAALRDYNARSMRSDRTKVTFLAKIKTTVQMGVISLYLFGLAMNNMMVLLFADILLLLAFLITLQTGLQYTYQTFKK